MRWLLFDIWSKRVQTLLVALLALTVNLVAPVPGGAQTVNPQTSAQRQTINQVTPNKQSDKKPAQHNLPNTGPGSVTAVFVTSTFLAALAYRRALLYRHAS
jgi:hypothetical protein